jgi:hypothetical protein
MCGATVGLMVAGFGVYVSSLVLGHAVGNILVMWRDR